MDSPRTIPSMSPSPLHGIFSALGQERSEEDSTKRGTPPKGHSPVTGHITIDIYEQDNYYIIKCPLAGVHTGDIDIEISDNVVTIRGTRRQADTAPEQHYHLQECFWGEFSRSITLPCSIDPRRVKATFNKECILKIIIPKEERVKVVRISAE
ncbi:Hsp20/alpha crystallin family protein [Candidatus Peregrinibacteria bacterium]|nr:Hsp20/alpha crystallin family protein [Candidatus Peregrinibacteria bacterium]